MANFEPMNSHASSSPSQFRIKQRTFEEMEHDLSNEKIFDMTIEIKGLSLLLPEYGHYKQ